MNAFHVCGSLLAIWALVVSFLGITREGFPGGRAGERAVGTISMVLVLLAVGTAIYTGATEEEEEHEAGEAAVLAPAA